MSSWQPLHARVLYRAASTPLIGYSLLLSWHRGWLPTPQRIASARLRDGRTMRCRLADRTQRTMYFGLFEPGETRLVRDMLDAGGSFVDVGAHIGWFSTLASKRVGTRGMVLAIEPYQPNAALLKENLALNGCLNVSIVEKALGSESGTLSLGEAGDSGGVTALEWARNGRTTVPMTTIDDITAGMGAVGLMKIDVEGWEAHVLRGAQQTLPRTAAVLIEINRGALRKAGSSPEELVSLLKDSGFDTFKPVARRGIRRLHRNPIQNILATRRGTPGC